MRKIIEYTLVSLDGVIEDPNKWGLASFRDDAYMKDGFGQLLACDAMLMGRNTYEAFTRVWSPRTDPWAERVKAIRKYVFSSKLDKAEWSNSTVVRGDVIAEVTKLKQQAGADLIVYGHGLLGETLLKHNLLDVLNLLVVPLFVGHGKLFFRDGEDAKFRLNEAKSFAKGIVKLSYEPQNQ